MDLSTLMPYVPYVLFGALGGSILVLFFLGTRRTPPRTATPATSRQELSDMRIAFQTMREVLREQKQLAREFNEGLEQKALMIRRSVHVALEDIERLRRTQQELAEMVEELQGEYYAMQRQLGHLSKERNDLTDDPGMGRDRLESHVGPVRSEDFTTTSLQENGMELSEQDDHWTGLDFFVPSSAREESMPEPLQEETEPEETELPVDRIAFEAILNLEPGARFAQSDARNTGNDGRAGIEKDEQNSSPSLKDYTGDASAAGAENERRRLAGIYARVQAYSDAGMTAGQIARELGLGKAEIRLILNLRNHRT